MKKLDIMSDLFFWINFFHKTALLHLKKKLNLKVSIGMKNNFDSLNVSVAAGILIYELK